MLFKCSDRFPIMKRIECVIFSLKKEILKLADERN